MNTLHFTFFRFCSHSPKTLIGIFLVQYPPRFVIPLNFSSFVPSQHILSSLAHPSFVSLLFWLSFFLTCLPLPVLSLHCRTSLRFSSFLASHFHPYIRSITSSLFSHLRIPIYFYTFPSSVLSRLIISFSYVHPKASPLIFVFLSLSSHRLSFLIYYLRFKTSQPHIFLTFCSLSSFTSRHTFSSHTHPQPFLRLILSRPLIHLESLLLSTHIRILARLRFYIFPSLVLCCPRQRLPLVLAFSRPLLSLSAVVLVAGHSAASF